MSKEYEKIRTKIAKEYKEKVVTLEHQVKNLQEENLVLKEKNTLLESELEVKNEWVERMLEYCNMTSSDLQTILTNEKKREELCTMFLQFSNVLRSYS